MLPSPTYALPLSFAQVMQFVRQLPLPEKRRLSDALQAEPLNAKLGELLNAFRKDELTEAEITGEVGAVRAAMRLAAV